MSYPFLPGKNQNQIIVLVACPRRVQPGGNSTLPSWTRARPVAPWSGGLIWEGHAAGVFFNLICPDLILGWKEYKTYLVGQKPFTRSIEGKISIKKLGHLKWFYPSAVLSWCTGRCWHMMFLSPVNVTQFWDELNKNIVGLIPMLGASILHSLAMCGIPIHVTG